MTFVLCPLANDAMKNTISHRYRGLGPHAQKRHTAAINWQQDRLPTAPVVWAFGAGTEVGYHGGPTLAIFAENFVRQQLPKAEVVSNRSKPHFYGTFEEMKFIVGMAETKYLQGTIRFVFFAPVWHLARAKLIWLLFYRRQWGKAVFVATEDGATFEMRHEMMAWARICLIRAGLVKSRDQTPYQQIKRNGHTEC